MIEYIIPDNPDDRILKKACAILRDGGIVVVPTDTNWVMLCDPFSKRGLEKMRKIKGEEKSKHFSMLAADFSQASEIALITDNAFRLLKNRVPGHYTFVFLATKKLIKAVKASKTDHEVGVRFVPCPMVNGLINFFGGVLASTNITHEMLGLDDQEDVYSYLIEENMGSVVDLILDPGEYEFAGPSSMVSFVNDDIQVLREGAGDVSLFIR